MAGLVGSLVIGLQARTDQLERDLKKARDEIRQTKQSVVDAQSTLRGLGTSLTVLAAGAVSVGALTAAVKHLVTTGIELKNLQTSFALIAGSTEKGRAEFAFLRDTANTLGIDLKTLSGDYRSLTAATRGTAAEGEDTRKLFTALTTASRHYGMSTEQTGRAVQAFAQIISKGKVEQEELRGQLAEAIPGAMQIAARAFGVGTEELGKMVEQGLVSIKFLKAFTEQLQRETPVATEMAGKGMAQLGNEILELKATIANSGLVQFLDDLAARGARLLAIARQAAEESQRMAQEALGPGAGQATADELRQAAKLAEESRRQPATSAGWLPWNWRPGFGQAQEARDKLARMQAEMSRRQAERNLSGEMLLEAGLAPSQQTNRTALEAIEAQKEAEITQGKYNAILNREDARREAEEKAASAAKQRAREAASEAKRFAREREQEEERLATETVQRLRDIQAEEDRNIESLRALASNYGTVKEARDADTASMLTAQLATSQYAAEAERLAQVIADVQKVEAQLPQLRAEAERSAAALADHQTGTASLERYEELLSLGPSRYAREYLKAKGELEPLRGVEGIDPARIDAVLRQLEPKFRQTQQVIEHAAAAVGDFFFGTLQQIASGELFRGTGDQTSVQDRMRLVELKAQMTQAQNTLGLVKGDQHERQRLEVVKLNQEYTRLTESIEEAAQKQETAFGRIAESFTKMVTSVLMESSGFKQAMGDLLVKGLGAVVNLIGGGISANPTQYASAIGPTIDGGFLSGGFAQGGPVMRDGFYMVGERGPEIVRMHAGDYVYPNAQGPGGGTVTVHMTVHANDAGSFKRSQGEIQGRLLSAIRGAARHG